MRCVVDDQLREESVRYAFRFTCEACAHFELECRACANGFPTEPHRSIDLKRCGQVVFCKLFELG